jgi:hypothetical protein
VADKKPGWKARGFALGCAALGAAVAGEVAASSISAAIGHDIGPRWGGLLIPFDGFRALWTVDNLCVLQSHAAEWRASIMPGAHAVAGPSCRLRPPAIASINLGPALWLVAGFVPLAGQRLQFWLASQAPLGRVLPRPKRAPGFPVIEVGVASTGTIAAKAFAAKGLPRAIRAGCRVLLTRAELRLNMICFGGTGAGKTSQFFNSILLQCFAQQFGALIGNSKGDYDVTVFALARKAGREDDVRFFGIDAEEVNVFESIAPNMVSTHTSALLRLTDKSEKAGMWNAQGSNHAQAVLGVLWYYRKYAGVDEYTFCGLNRYLFTPGFGCPERDKDGNPILLGQSVDEQMGDVITSIQTKLRGIPESDESRAALRAELKDDLLNIRAHYQQIQTLDKDRQAKFNVEFTLTQLLNAICTPTIERAFFNTNLPKSAIPFNLDLTYTDGTIFGINTPEDIIGEPASRALTVLVKKLFFGTMGRRRYYGENVDQSRLVVCAFDEAQDFITEGDQTALAKLRDTDAFCLWATQSAMALEDRVGKVLAKTVLSNMRQKFYLRLEDDATIEMALKVLGDVEVEKQSTSSTQQPGKWSPSKGTTTATHKERAATADLILNLEGDEAYCTLTIDRLAAVGIMKTNYENPLS